MKKTLILLALLLVAVACGDDISSTYSRKYRVMCGFQVVSYAELQNVVGNFGQFATIRQRDKYIVMQSQIGTHEYAMDALSKDFCFGLGGLIVGTTQFGELRAYDLACRNCDRVERRLTVRDNGTAVCSKCEIGYDLNNNGVILNKGNGMHEHPKGLYRYQATCDGMRLNVTN